MAAMSGYNKPCKYGGSVWIEQEFGRTWYTLFVNGDIKAQSGDWNYIVNLFNGYVA